MENMRKIVMHLHTGYCGMDTDVAFLVPHSVTDDELSDRAYWEAVEHAGSYGIYLSSDEEDDEETAYSGENIEGSWHEYIPERDECKLVYGCNDEVHWNHF